MVEIRVESMTVEHGFDSDFIKRVRMYSFPFPNFSIKNLLCKTVPKNGLSLRESRERNDIQRGKEFQCCVADDPLADVLLKKDIIDSPIRMIQLIHLNESQERETEL